ncbi:hypothetical protein RchiOBHm_Chr1g0350641 [Rosa chinensis]|uniref:Morc S5 domain-containing protein n=1 Tax=Rosa chinensis TaxID=74649 RepID=A0A2P6SG53_ROSCH|nr:hypothetical protein RchiOBHm_Chr1g0350641 [Rosa chinensis]
MYTYIAVRYCCYNATIKLYLQLQSKLLCNYSRIKTAYVFNGGESYGWSLGEDLVSLTLCYTNEHTLCFTDLNCLYVDYKFNPTTETLDIMHGREHFMSNLYLLLQWSQYSTEAELLKQFNDIGAHGTEVMIYNLWFNDDGSAELDFDTDPEGQVITTIGFLNDAPYVSYHGFNLYHKNRLILVSFPC